jgi:Ca2+-binding RTX toxin-like protein
MGVRGVLCAVVFGGLVFIAPSEAFRAGCNPNLALQDRYLSWGAGIVIDFKAAAQTRITNPCRFVGTARDDKLKGTPFLDFLVGLRGDDVLRGLGGRDRLTGGTGRDRLEGGDGADTIIARDGRRDVVRGGDDNDSARIDRGLDDVSGVEKLLP